MNHQVNIWNPRARFAYELTGKYVAGMQLTGTEIKSIRWNKADIKSAFCQFKNGEIYLINMFIAPYESGSYYNHEPRRARKLLLNKRELKKLEAHARVVGHAIIPTRVFLSDRGIAKVAISLAKGRKLRDKRQYVREREDKRDLKRISKY
ncbi:MAG: SsrA-binding protein SmpB [Flavobacteriales bacterium]